MCQILPKNYSPHFQAIETKKYLFCRKIISKVKSWSFFSIYKVLKSYLLQFSSKIAFYLKHYSTFFISNIFYIKFKVLLKFVGKKNSKGKIKEKKKCFGDTID